MTAVRRPAALIEEDAAQWIVRREESGWSERDEAELEAWLDQAMAHRAAFWRLEHGWRAADRVAALGETDATGPWRRVRLLRWLKVRDHLPRSAISAGIAASLALVIGVAWWRQPATPWGQSNARDYRTPQGGTPVGDPCGWQPCRSQHSHRLASVARW